MKLTLEQYVEVSAKVSTRNAKATNIPMLPIMSAKLAHEVVMDIIKDKPELMICALTSGVDGIFGSELDLTKEYLNDISYKTIDRMMIDFTTFLQKQEGATMGPMKAGGLELKQVTINPIDKFIGPIAVTSALRALSNSILTELFKEETNENN